MMTDSIKADVLYFKTLPYEEIFRLFKEPFKSNIEEYNAEFDALYNK